MKVLLGWLCDPCVDLILIGVLLVQFAMTVGADPEIPDPDFRAPHCQVCGCFHAEHPICPAVLATEPPISLADSH